MTHDFIYACLSCRFKRLLSENVIKKWGWGGVTVVVFKISNFENANFASFRPDVIMAFYGKCAFLGLPSCIKIFILKKKKKKKTSHNFVFKN